jgi:DNA-binding protein HU-beta
MNKAQLIDAVAVKLEISRRAAGDAVDAVLGGITGAVIDGDKVSLTGFGTFEQVKRPARTARNPRTGDAVKVAAAVVPKFRAGQAFKDEVNGSKGKKSAAKKSAAKKPAAKKSTAMAKKASPAKKATSVAKKAAPAKKTVVAKKTTAVKTVGKQASPVKKSAAAKKTTATARPVAKKSAAKAPATKTAAKKATAKKSAPAKRR